MGGGPGLTLSFSTKSTKEVRSISTGCPCRSYMASTKWKKLDFLRLEGGCFSKCALARPTPLQGDKGGGVGSVWGGASPPPRAAGTAPLWGGPSRGRLWGSDVPDACGVLWAGLRGRRPWGAVDTETPMETPPVMTPHRDPPQNEPQ